VQRPRTYPGPCLCEFNSTTAPFVHPTLDISHDTVKLHVRQILAKLNLSSRVEAAVFAVEHRVTPKGRGEGR